MKAAVFHEPGKPLSIEDVPEPTPGPRDLLLRVTGCGICGSDLHMSEQPMAPGMVMGHEFAGEVVDKGAEVRDFAVGDRVASLPLRGCGRCIHCLAGATPFCTSHVAVGLGGDSGGYAEYVVAGADESFVLPDIVSGTDGAMVEPLAVGLHVVDSAELRPNDNVLIVGAGPVGIATTLWARHLGAREIGVSDPVDHRRDLAGQHGATFGIDPTSEDVGEAFARQAGGPPDVIIECVGVPGIIQDCFKLARPRSRFIVAGVCIQPDRIVPVIAVMKELTVKFVSFYGKPDFAYTIDMLRRERIDPSRMVTDVIGLGALPDAFEALRRPTTQCKVIVEPNRA